MIPKGLLLPVALSTAGTACGSKGTAERDNSGEIEAPATASAPDAVVELADGRRIWFRGDTTPGNDFRIYEHEGIAEPLDAHVIKVSLYEGGAYALVHRVSGDTAWLGGPPVVSPSGKRVAATSVDLIAGYDPNILQIFVIRDDQFVEDLVHTSEHWGPSDAHWIAEDSLQFTKNTVNDRLEYEKEPGMAIRSEGGWRLVVMDSLGTVDRSGA